MLKLKNICKDYVTGESVVHALSDVSINFRKNEFVAVLGASGCGKTTMLNIVGGLDRYSDGDLVIAGRSTKDFKDRDWDFYRNHSIGFVFQSYNLIPHQTVLANVELALTLSGVSKAERRKKAVAALEKVGLGDQIKKKPNQMSGGQMQRVAIARALVNDPEIILADEPTGALDSETSVQIMNILKEISHDKLIIMVTHNPELANEYASRIINLKDGRVLSDSLPFSEEDEEKEISEVNKKTEKKRKEKSKTSMSFATALSLSLNNLLTKKGRTFLTSFAGSIGIIGIALILALSNGIDLYITQIQEDTLSTYPLTIESETMDMGAMMNAMMGASMGGSHDLDAVYANPVIKQMLTAMNAGMKENNLTDFKKFLESKGDEVTDLLLDLRYNYDVSLNVFHPDTSDGINQINPSTLMDEMYASMGITGAEGMSSIATEMYGLNVWSEMLSNDKLLKEQYDVIEGRMPESYNEIVLVVTDKNELSDLTLYTLGLLDPTELDAIFEEVMGSMMGGEKVDKDKTDTEQNTKWEKFEYSEILNLTYKLVLPTSFYKDNGDGTFTDMRKDEAYMKAVIEQGVDLKVVGILRPNPDATATSISGAIGYTKALTQYVIDGINDSSIVKAQLDSPAVDVLTGLPFGDPDEMKPTMDDFNGYLSSLPEEIKIQYEISLVMMGKMEFADIAQKLALMDEEARTQAMVMLVAAGKYEDPIISGYIESLEETEKRQLQIMAAMFANMTDEKFLEYLSEDESFSAYLVSVGKVPSEASYKGNLKLLGYTTPDTPSSIDIYAKDFESKEAILALIDEYNKGKSDEDSITYTDIIGLALSSMTTIVDFVSYALIAFVSISLVVSSIMIGIITYISVLERTKEIGILRSIGASKKDISRVFNAETLIVGLAAGIIGILSTLLLSLPINAIIYALGDVKNITQLPAMGAFILIAISMGLTLIAGLVPSRMAAKKDPVEALRSE